MSVGQQYGFTFDFVAEDPANITWFREAWNNVNYTNGLELLSRDGGDTWNTVSDSMAFWVVQTPEPTTILFMGCGAAGLLRKRRAKVHGNSLANRLNPFEPMRARSAAGGRADRTQVGQYRKHQPTPGLQRGRGQIIEERDSCIED